jgi:hypothetical protein
MVIVYNNIVSTSLATLRLHNKGRSVNAVSGKNRCACRNHTNCVGKIHRSSCQSRQAIRLCTVNPIGGSSYYAFPCIIGLIITAQGTKLII